MADEPAVQPTAYLQPGATEPTAEQLAEAEKFFTTLEKEADIEKWKYMDARVPSYLQKKFLEAHPDPRTPVEGAPPA